MAVLTGCQVQGEVAVEVREDGAGAVRVRFGVDEAARRRLGDPASALRLDDLIQAGWRVTGPDDDDGVTWWTAEKPFADPAGLPEVLGEVAGPEVVRDVRLERVETDDDVTLRLTGVLDLSPGAAAFSDAEVAAVLDGDPLGGNVAAIEAAEGRPLAEMVTATLSLDVAGVRQQFSPRLGDPPVPFEVVAVKKKPVVSTVWLAVGAAVLVVVLTAAGLLALRRRFALGR